MIKATRNQLANVRNPYQGPDQKVLCVCSAGLLRSPTLAEYLNKEYGYNTRACGTSQEYALVPISQALVAWADLIVFVNEENFDAVDEGELVGKRINILDLPDEFSRNEEGLKAAIKAQWEAI